MEFPATLLSLAGTVALLLWGVRMVQTGIQRAYGPRLRLLLAGAVRTRWSAAMAGLGVTAILQSSTATSLMVAGFVGSGMLELVPALAAMLGANVGTTLIVQVLAFDISAAAPALILIGVLAFRRSDGGRARDLGRVAIGLGLMLMALHQLLALLTPYEDAPSLRLMLGAIADQPVLDVVLAAAMTWAAHSSVSVILLVMSLAAKGVVSPHAAFAMVLGANLGTALVPLLESGHGQSPTARQMLVGNLLTRAVGVALALPVLGFLGRALLAVEPDPARAVAHAHTAFNLILALAFLPLLDPYARLLARLLPPRVDQPDPSRPAYLDDSAREVPAVALGAAAREALRLADVLEEMLAAMRDAFAQGDRRRIAEARRLDDVLDRLNAAIKAYLTGIDPAVMVDADHRRVEEILAFATNLEHAGDVVDRNLLTQAAKRVKRNVAFSREGEADLLAIMARLNANLRAAASVFMTGDPRAARLLAAEKSAFRDLETAATQAHFARLRAGRPETAETSGIHLDVLRDLKRVNDHLVAAAAYPVLHSQGELLPSRLREE